MDSLSLSSKNIFNHICSPFSYKTKQSSLATPSQELSITEQTPTSLTIHAKALSIFIGTFIAIAMTKGRPKNKLSGQLLLGLGSGVATFYGVAFYFKKCKAQLPASVLGAPFTQTAMITWLNKHMEILHSPKEDSSWEQFTNHLKNQENQHLMAQLRPLNEQAVEQVKQAWSWDMPPLLSEIKAHQVRMIGLFCLFARAYVSFKTNPSHPPLLNFDQLQAKPQGLENCKSELDAMEFFRQWAQQLGCNSKWQMDGNKSQQLLHENIQDLQATHATQAQLDYCFLPLFERYATRQKTDN